MNRNGEIKKAKKRQVKLNGCFSLPYINEIANHTNTEIGEWKQEKAALKDF